MFSILTLNKILSLLEVLAAICFYLKNILKEKLSQENACKMSKYTFVTPRLSMYVSALYRFLCPTYAGVQRCTFWEGPVKPHH